jgi:hypothetical protein
MARESALLPEKKNAIPKETSSSKGYSRGDYFVP